MSKENISYETSNVEEGRGGGGPPLVRADQVELRDERVDELLRVVAPAVLALHLGPAGVWLGRPGAAVLLEDLGPVDLVHPAPAVQPQVAVLPLQRGPQVESLGPVQLRGDLVEVRLTAPVVGLVGEEHLQGKLVSKQTGLLSVQGSPFAFLCEPQTSSEPVWF